MKKKWFVILSAVIGVAAMNNVAYASEWIKDSNGWWYQYDDGSYPVSNWTEINGKEFYFEDTGYLRIGPTSPNSVWKAEDGTDVSWSNMFSRQGAYINQTLIEDMKLTFGELKEKYSGVTTSGAAWLMKYPYGVTQEYIHQGTAVYFADSPINYYTIDDNSFPFGEKESYSQNYQFWDVGDGFSDASQLYQIRVPYGMTGLPNHCTADEFSAYLKKIGATDVKIIDKDLSRDYYSANGNVETKRFHHIGIRFQYDGSWFYVCKTLAAGENVLSYDDNEVIEVYQDLNPYMEEFTVDEEAITAPVYRKTLVAG